MLIAPRQASALALGGEGLSGEAALVLRRWMGKEARAPAAHWPLLAAVRLQPPARGGGAARAAVPWRFTSMTLNAWTTNELERRRAPLEALLRSRSPDVLAVQASSSDRMTDALIIVRPPCDRRCSRCRRRSG